MARIRLPVFVEALEGEQVAGLQVCRMVAAGVFKRHGGPLPFVASETQLKQVTAALEEKGLAPALYVVNTFEAENLLKAVDRRIGDTPLLLLHREIYSFNLVHKKQLRDTTRLLQGLRPRLTVLCGYGPQTAHLLAERVAEALCLFLEDGNFAYIEALSSRLTISASPEI